MGIPSKKASFSAFLESLFDDGRVLVAGLGPIARKEQQQAVEVLARFEQDWREEMSCRAPRYSVEAALWGATLVYRAAQFTVFRDAGAEEIERELSTACPVVAQTSAHYSADLTFRFLPELARLAACAAEDDPLVGALKRLAAAWPLSSVGMPGMEPEAKAIDTVTSEASLLRLYVDRIVRHRDFGRLQDRRVLSELEFSQGAFPELVAGLPQEITELMKTRETA